MPNEGCCSNAIVSRSDPCCAQRWAMRFDLNTNTLKIMDDRWIVITWGDVNSVNGKTWSVTLTPQDILGSGTWYYTEGGRRLPALAVMSWSDSLITSGAVYSYMAQIETRLQALADLVNWDLTNIVTWDQVDTAITPTATSNKVPTSAAVLLLVSQMTDAINVWIQWTAPINVSSTERNQFSLTVSRATHNQQDWFWVCRLANLSDYMNEDSEAVLTSDVIKPIIDSIIDHINDVESQANENETNIQHMQTAINGLTNRVSTLETKVSTLETKVSALETANAQQQAINQLLQQQIDELRALIPNP